MRYKTVVELIEAYDKGKISRENCLTIYNDVVYLYEDHDKDGNEIPLPEDKWYSEHYELVYEYKGSPVDFLYELLAYLNIGYEEP